MRSLFHLFLIVIQLIDVDLARQALAQRKLGEDEDGLVQAPAGDQPSAITGILSPLRAEQHRYGDHKAEHLYEHCPPVLHVRQFMTDDERQLIAVRRIDQACVDHDDLFERSHCIRVDLRVLHHINARGFDAQPTGRRFRDRMDVSQVALRSLTL